MAETGEALRAEAERLRQQLEELTFTEPPTDAKALVAHGRRLEKLTDDYRQTLLAIQRAERPSGPTPATKSEPTVERPVQGGYGDLGSAVGRTENVSLTQANYDRQGQLDRQKMLADAEAKARADALQAIQEHRWTAEQARDKYNQQLDQIRQEGEAQARALTARGQEITLRGQDASAGVSQRGQDLDYEQTLAGQSVSMANAILPYLNAPGQRESFNSLMAGGPPVPTQAIAPPFDVRTFPIEAAQAARAQAPGRYVLPSAPAPVPVSSTYVLPGGGS